MPLRERKGVMSSHRDKKSANVPTQTNKIPHKRSRQGYEPCSAPFGLSVPWSFYYLCECHILDHIFFSWLSNSLPILQLEISEISLYSSFGVSVIQLDPIFVSYFYGQNHLCLRSIELNICHMKYAQKHSECFISHYISFFIITHKWNFILL